MALCPLTARLDLDLAQALDLMAQVVLVVRLVAVHGRILAQALEQVTQVVPALSPLLAQLDQERMAL
jgi:hypothetical protein